jgi:hypothetical protein
VPAERVLDSIVLAAMTGSDLREIREGLGLARLAFGRALGYRGTDNSVGVMVRRAETCREVAIHTARLAEMFEEFGVPERYLDSAARPMNSA